MPHIRLEYSSNLEAIVDMAALVEKIRLDACRLDALPMPGLRVRAVAVVHYAIADGDAKHGFIDMVVRLREGRTDDVKKDAIMRLFDTLKDFMAPALARHPIALSAEIRDIQAEFAPKYGTIRDHLET